MLLARAVLDAVVGVLLLVAAGLLAVGRRAAAVRLATYGLLAALTVVNTLVFYFEQFLAAVGALAQGTVLALTSAYDRRYGRS